MRYHCATTATRAMTLDSFYSANGYSFTRAASEPFSAATTMSSTTSTQVLPAESKVADPLSNEDCLSCRVIGSVAMTGVGIYALQLARPTQPGPPAVKRVYTGIGILMLGLGALIAAGWPKNKCVLATAWSL